MMNDHSLPKKIRGNFRRNEPNQNKLRTVLDGSIIVKVAYKARDKKDTGFQWPTPELFDKIWAAHPWSGTEKTSDPPPNQNQ